MTIRGSADGSGSFTEKGVYGGKRILITSRPGEPPLLEQTFNVVRNKEAQRAELLRATSPPLAPVAITGDRPLSHTHTHSLSLPLYFSLAVLLTYPSHFPFYPSHFFASPLDMIRCMYILSLPPSTPPFFSPFLLWLDVVMTHSCHLPTIPPSPPLSPTITTTTNNNLLLHLLHPGTSLSGKEPTPPPAPTRPVSLNKGKQASNQSHNNPYSPPILTLTPTLTQPWPTSYFNHNP